MNARVRRSVAIYEILIGLVAFVSAAVARAEAGWLQITFALAGGAVSLIAGALLWQDKSIARGLSLIVQALQVPQISISGVVQYGIGLGAAITPHIGFVPESFQHAIYSSLRFGSQVDGFYFGVNVLALVALVLVAMGKDQKSPKSNRVVATA
jgi:hypothetical protein